MRRKAGCRGEQGSPTEGFGPELSRTNLRWSPRFFDALRIAQNDHGGLAQVRCHPPVAGAPFTPGSCSISNLRSSLLSSTSTSYPEVLPLTYLSWISDLGSVGLAQTANDTRYLPK